MAHLLARLRAQWKLALGLAVAGMFAAMFLVVVLGLPLANYVLPDLMARRVAGFTLTWLVVGVLFFPFVWVIAYVFIKRSIALEDAEVAEVTRGNAASPGAVNKP